jgi:hypothetical protein
VKTPLRVHFTRFLKLAFAPPEHRELLSSSERIARQHGIDAYEEGDLENRYSENSNLGRAWRKGFEEAEGAALQQW